MDSRQNHFCRLDGGGTNLRNSVRYGHSQTGNGMNSQTRAVARAEKPHKLTIFTGSNGSGRWWHARDSRAGRPVHPSKLSHYLVGNRTSILAVGFMLLMVGGLSGSFFEDQGLGYAQKRPSQNKSGPVEVPFEFVANQIVVEVRIAGKGPYSMLLDTDTDPSAIDLATARELGLSQDSKAFPATGGGTDTNVVHLTRLPTVELGSVVAKEVLAGAIDLSKLSAKLGKPIQGVLGYSFLKDRIIQIDYPETKIRFYNESPFPGIQYGPNTVNTIAMAFRYDDGVLIDSVFINGQKLKATLDTGSSGTFALTPEAVATLGMEEQAQNGEGEKSVGYNGEYESKSGLLKSVRIGRLSVESMPAAFWLPGTGHDKKKYQVNIGNGFFKDFIMTFDFHGKMVVFEKVE
jgi:predicted aspartyl protease